MNGKCAVCGEEFSATIEGTLKCRNGHEKKRALKHYTYPLEDISGR